MTSVHPPRVALQRPSSPARPNLNAAHNLVWLGHPFAAFGKDALIHYTCNPSKHRSYPPWRFRHIHKDVWLTNRPPSSPVNRCVPWMATASSAVDRTSQPKIGSISSVTSCWPPPCSSRDNGHLY